MADIAISSVSKVFAGDVRAVDDVSLDVDSGEFMVLVGPSGCGKSTLLRILAGIEDLTEGTVHIGGRDVSRLAARDRDIAMVFQNYALYPHMNVRENLGYGLRARKTAKPDIDRRVDEVARLLGLTPLLDRKPRALSGGQRQRVAMGRAMAREPVAYLMDEPLSNLDAKLRVDMREQLARLHDRLGVTTVYVTHDQIEAMTLGDRVTVLKAGRVQQVDSPQRLYRHPANLFVATFIGSPSMNLVEGRVEDGHVAFGSTRLPLARDRRPARREGETVMVGVRPEDFQDAAYSEPGLPTLEVRADIVEELGSEIHVVFRVDAPAVAAPGQGADGEQDGEESVPLLADEGGARFVAAVDPRSSIRQGEAATITLDPSRLHFFDPANGEALVGARG